MKKIDIFVAHHGAGRRYFAYAASTIKAPTCKAAKAAYYAAVYPRVALADIKCRFAK